MLFTDDITVVMFFMLVYLLDFRAANLGTIVRMYIQTESFTIDHIDTVHDIDDAYGEGWCI